MIFVYIIYTLYRNVTKCRSITGYVYVGRTNAHSSFANKCHPRMQWNCHYPNYSHFMILLRYIHLVLKCQEMSTYRKICVSTPVCKLAEQMLVRHSLMSIFPSCNGLVTIRGTPISWLFDAIYTLQ